jgi:hypothetical protein
MQIVTINDRLLIWQALNVDERKKNVIAAQNQSVPFKDKVKTLRSISK